MTGFAAITVAMTAVFANGLGPWLPIIFAIVMILNAIITLRKAKRQREEHQAKQRSEIEGQRTSEVRERMRQLAEERRRAQDSHHHKPAEQPMPLHVPDSPAPSAPPATATPTGRVPPIDPFGNSPLGRLLEELQKKVEQSQPPPPPVIVQHQPEPPPPPLPARPVMVSSEEASPDGMEGPTGRVVHRHDAPSIKRRRLHPLLAEIHHREALRKAFVLREVLGPPVAMR